MSAIARRAKAENPSSSQLALNIRLNVARCRFGEQTRMFRLVADAPKNRENSMKLAKLILAGAMLATVPSIALAQQSSTGTVSMINRLSGTIAIRQIQNGTVGASGGGTTEQQFAASADLLDSVHAGDSVKFTVTDANGKKTITKIERE
jgi:hypothetical protein